METAPSSTITEMPAWENIATSSRYGRYASKIEGRAIRRAASLIERPTIALDIGCDGGRWSMLLAEQGWKMVCTDIEQKSLDLCKQRIPTATCIRVYTNDITLPADTESLGLLLCIEVTSVIHSAWFIDEAYRTLHKGGLLVGVLWNRSSWRGLLYHFLPVLRTHNHGVRSSGWYPVSYSTWKQQLCQKGFSIIYEEGYAWLPSRRTSNSPLIPLGEYIEKLVDVRKLVNVSPMIAFIAQKC